MATKWEGNKYHESDSTTTAFWVNSSGHIETREEERKGGRRRRRGLWQKLDPLDKSNWWFELAGVIAIWILFGFFVYWFISSGFWE